MAVTAKGNTFTPCPFGLHHAVCVDVFDLGVLEVTYNGATKRQHKMDIYWESDEKNPDNGKPFLVRKRYTLSLDEKSTLRKDLESWRGKAFTPDEIRNGFDVERLLGANCQLNVTHVERAGQTYANVTAIVPPPKNAERLAPSHGFIRKKDRPVDAPAQPENGNAPADDDPDIPF